MAALRLQGNGDSGHYVSPENIQKTLDSLEDPVQKVNYISSQDLTISVLIISLKNNN